jgi:phosphohistidine phosphatase
MPKILYLVRHAKARQESIDNTDFSRELADRGIRDASIVGTYFKKREYEVDMIISSPAARALTTAELMAQQLDYKLESIHTNEELYLASVRTFLQVVNQLKDDWQSVLITSHDPAVTYLGEYLSGSEVGHMPTGSVMAISFKTDSWVDVAEKKGTLAEFITPRKLKDGEQ